MNRPYYRNTKIKCIFLKVSSLGLLLAGMSFQSMPRWWIRMASKSSTRGRKLLLAVATQRVSGHLYLEDRVVKRRLQV